MIITSSLMKLATEKQGEPQIRSPDWGWTQRGALFNLATWQTTRKKKKETSFSVYVWKRKYACANVRHPSHSFPPILKIHITFTWNIYIFPCLPRDSPAANCLLRLSVFFLFLLVCPILFCTPSSVLTVWENSISSAENIFFCPQKKEKKNRFFSHIQTQFY